MGEARGAIAQLISLAPQLVGLFFEESDRTITGNMNKAFLREIQRRLLTALPISIPMIETLIWAIGVSLLLVSGLITYILYSEIGKQKRPSYLRRNKLIRLVGGDRATAHRLASLEGGNWQAAIDKLIRDRR